jgi:hypothetical protein
LDDRLHNFILSTIEINHTVTAKFKVGATLIGGFNPREPFEPINMHFVAKPAEL